MKIRLVRAKLFLADGQMDAERDRRADITKLPVGFRNFVNAPENEAIFLVLL